MNNKINDEIILKIVDTFHDSTLIYYDALIDSQKDNTAVTNYNQKSKNKNYYECLMDIEEAFLDFKELNIDEESNNKINELFNSLTKLIKIHGLNSEEMRKALLFLDINGFKHLNFPLDYITPDVIGTICCYLIEHTIRKKEINLLDFNFGVGNLAFYVANHLEKKVNLIGIENHSLLVNVASHKADLMQRELVLYHQDALEYLPIDVDVVLVDVATNEYENKEYNSELYLKGVRYFPYLAIEKYLELEGDPLFIYMIDNNFFEKDHNDSFKKFINEKAQIICLITLPLNLFQSQFDAKSILVIQKKKNKPVDSAVYSLPEIKNQQAFMNVMMDIIEHINNKRK